MIFCKSKNSKGNALFLILIAVALFAALSYAITQSSRGGGSVDKEEARLEASQILQTSAFFKSNLERFMLISGLDLREVSFWGSHGQWGYRNSPTYPASQHFLYPEGGGHTWPGDGWRLSAASHVPGFGRSENCTESDPCGDLFLRLRVPLETCMEINKIAGITNTDGKPPVDRGDFSDTHFKGTNDIEVSGSNAFDGTNDENEGKLFGCLETLHGYRGGPGAYYFYYVLMTDIDK
ncbi:MAG: hypothetical protein ACQEQL_05740 [Pseudomonadota bacterium]